MPLVLEAWLAVKGPDLECVYFSCATRWEDLWYEARLPPLPPSANRRSPVPWEMGNANHGRSVGKCLGEPVRRV